MEEVGEEPQLSQASGSLTGSLSSQGETRCRRASKTLQDSYGSSRGTCPERWRHEEQIPLDQREKRTWPRQRTATGREAAALHMWIPYEHFSTSVHGHLPDYHDTEAGLERWPPLQQAHPTPPPTPTGWG